MPHLFLYLEEKEEDWKLHVVLPQIPIFILLDEPLAGIDPIAIQDVKNLIQNLKKKEYWRSHNRS